MVVEAAAIKKAEVMIELFPTDVLVGWFPNQNEQRALVSHGPLRTHVTNLFVSVNLSHRQQFRTLSVRYQANTDSKTIKIQLVPK